MSAMFANPPKPDKIPPVVPKPNTGVQLQAAQAGRRQGLQAALFGGGGPPASTTSHTLTGQ